MPSLFCGFILLTVSGVSFAVSEEIIVTQPITATTTTTTATTTSTSTTTKGADTIPRDPLDTPDWINIIPTGPINDDKQDELPNPTKLKIIASWVHIVITNNDNPYTTVQFVPEESWEGDCRYLEHMDPDTLILTILVIDDGEHFGELDHCKIAIRLNIGNGHKTETVNIDAFNLLLEVQAGVEIGTTQAMCMGRCNVKVMENAVIDSLAVASPYALIDNRALGNYMNADASTLEAFFSYPENTGSQRQIQVIAQLIASVVVSVPPHTKAAHDTSIREIRLPPVDNEDQMLPKDAHPLISNSTEGSDVVVRGSNWHDTEPDVLMGVDLPSLIVLPTPEQFFNGEVTSKGSVSSSPSPFLLTIFAISVFLCSLTLG